MQTRELDDARRLLAESKSELDQIIQRYPNHHPAMALRAEVRLLSAQVAWDQGNVEDSARFLEAAIADGERAMLTVRDQRVVEDLLSARWRLAKLQARRGDREYSVRLVKANRRMLTGLVQGTREPSHNIARILAHIDIESSILGSWPKRNLSEAFETADALDPLRKLGSPDACLMTDEAWEGLADDALHALTQTDPGSIRESDAGLELIKWLGGQAQEHRMPRQMDMARKMTARMRVFAGKLVMRCPDQAAAHMALCIAFGAIAEDCLLTDDRVAVERNWKLGLVECVKPCRLILQTKRIYDELAKIQQRLPHRTVWNQANGVSRPIDAEPTPPDRSFPNP